jgi:hypothetical protein
MAILLLEVKTALAGLDVAYFEADVDQRLPLLLFYHP